MLTISESKFKSFTEIVTRWESGYDLPSPTVKSIRDRLLPIAVSLRGFCVTPEDVAAVSPAVEPEDWRLGNGELVLGTNTLPTQPIAALSMGVDDDSPPQDGPAPDPDEKEKPPEELEPPEEKEQPPEEEKKVGDPYES